jgi:hypothetical protein
MPAFGGKADMVSRVIWDEAVATRDEYHALRRRFEPETAKLLVVAESPPASGKYFYDTSGAITEALFAALMQQINCSPASKEDGLRAFQQRGWVLVDATYAPMNRLSERKRDAVIVRGYPLLRDDLTALSPDRSAPVVLLKANVCRLLDERLTGDGFRVLNRGRVVYFPSHGRQKEFHQQFGEIVGAIR